MPNESISIRPAARADMAVLGTLGARLVHLHYGFDRARFMAPVDGLEAGYAQFLASRMSRRDAEVLVATVGETVAGYAYITVEPPSWEELREEAGFIHDIIVDEAMRGHGLAAQLVDAAIQWFRARRVRRVVLWTAEQNAPAQRLFAKAGFRRTMVEMTREI